jgi:hypothetical protein
MEEARQDPDVLDGASLKQAQNFFCSRGELFSAAAAGHGSVVNHGFTLWSSFAFSPVRQSLSDHE